MIYGFGITALLLMACGYKVVRSTDLVRMVLFLAGALFMTAVAYIQLGADLLGGLQVLLYTGGIVTLMLFAVLLTWQKEDGVPTGGVFEPLRGGLCALLLFGTVVCALLADVRPESLGIIPDPQAVGHLFLTQHVLAFEALSVLLLAVMIGAIVLARRSDP